LLQLQPFGPQVSEKQARQWGDQHRIPVLETSAKSDTNVSEAFQTILQLALHNRRAEEPPAFPPTATLDFDEQPRAKASGCC